tara:strand:- start:3753 stop:4277 length:525 start_codon:yes stop_codon:yes gene_type:complete
MIQQLQFAFYSLFVAAFGAVIAIMLKRQSNKTSTMNKQKMSNPNETLMLTFGMGVVMAWVTIAAAASYFSVVEQRDISDSQLTVIGLLGGPALLIITNVLDLFKGKETAKIAVLPDQLSAEVSASTASKEHTRMLEEYKLKHDLDMEKLQKQHSLEMEAFQITNGKVKDAKKDK